MPMNQKTEHSFQRRMPARVAKILEKSDIGLDQFHLEYFYWTDLNFGKLFKHPRAVTDLESALMEAIDNTPPGLRSALIASRPHDNYYIVMDSEDLELSQKSARATVMYVTLPGQDGSYVVMNLKGYLEI